MAEEKTTEVSGDSEITPLVLCEAYLSQVNKSDSMAVLIEPKVHGKEAYAAFSVFDKKFKVTFEEVKRARRRKADIEKTEAAAEDKKEEPSEPAEDKPSKAAKKEPSKEGE